MPITELDEKDAAGEDRATTVAKFRPARATTSRTHFKLSILHYRNAAMMATVVNLASRSDFEN